MAVFGFVCFVLSLVLFGFVWFCLVLPSMKVIPVIVYQNFQSWSMLEDNMQRAASQLVVTSG
jgi:hypothetical protein